MSEGVQVVRNIDPHEKAELLRKTLELKAAARHATPLAEQSSDVHAASSTDVVTIDDSASESSGSSHSDESERLQAGRCCSRGDIPEQPEQPEDTNGAGEPDGKKDETPEENDKKPEEKDEKPKEKDEKHEVEMGNETYETAEKPKKKARMHPVDLSDEEEEGEGNPQNPPPDEQAAPDWNESGAEQESVSSPTKSVGSSDAAPAAERSCSRGRLAAADGDGDASDDGNDTNDTATVVAAPERARKRTRSPPHHPRPPKGEKPRRKRKRRRSREGNRRRSRSRGRSLERRSRERRRRERRTRTRNLSNPRGKKPVVLKAREAREGPSSSQRSRSRSPNTPKLVPRQGAVPVPPLQQERQYMGWERDLQPRPARMGVGNMPSNADAPPTCTEERATPKTPNLMMASYVVDAECELIPFSELVTKTAWTFLVVRFTDAVHPSHHCRTFLHQASLRARSCAANTDTPIDQEKLVTSLQYNIYMVTSKSKVKNTKLRVYKAEQFIEHCDPHGQVGCLHAVEMVLNTKLQSLENVTVAVADLRFMRTPYQIGAVAAFLEQQKISLLLGRFGLWESDALSVAMLAESARAQHKAPICSGFFHYQQNCVVHENMWLVLAPARSVKLHKLALNQQPDNSWWSPGSYMWNHEFGLPTCVAFWTQPTECNDHLPNVGHVRTRAIPFDKADLCIHGVMQNCVWTGNRPGNACQKKNKKRARQRHKENKAAKRDAAAAATAPQAT